MEGLAARRQSRGVRGRGGRERAPGAVVRGAGGGLKEAKHRVGHEPVGIGAMPRCVLL